MEINYQGLGLDSTEHPKTLETAKKIKLESVPHNDKSGAVDSLAKQSTTNEPTNMNTSRSDCESKSVDSELSPQEFVFSIDHVFEQILSLLDPTTLFNCRLVSHSWRITSTEIILERVDATATFKYSPKDQDYVKQRTGGDANAADKSTLDDLNRFLKESYSQTGPFKMSEFPCKQLDFLEGSLCHPQLQSFLTMFGENISILFLDFKNSLGGESEATLLKHIGHLLNTQTPNLQSMHLYLSPKLAITGTCNSQDGDLGSNDNGLFPSLQNDQESREIQPQGKSGIRKLDCINCPSKILDYIISISPKLVEIRLYCQDYHLLSSPLNRLHFLKEFQFKFVDDDSFNFENFKLIAAALCISNEERESQNLPLIKFTRLSMDFGNILETLSSRPDIQSCFVSVISKILELSWDTLESIAFVDQDEDTLRGIKWPLVLPKVRELELSLGIAIGSGLQLLHSNRNFKIQERFPQLETLTFDEVIDYDTDEGITSAGEFLRSCNFGPAPNVKFVEVTLCLYVDPPDMDVAEDVLCISSEMYLSLAYLFPGAELTIKDEVLSNF